MPATIERIELSSAIRAALRRSPAVALVGPRQVGKTTLAREHLAPASPNYFDLENPLDLAARGLAIGQHQQSSERIVRQLDLVEQRREALGQLLGQLRADR